MGAYLSEPNLNKDSLDDGNENIAYGASSMQGWRLEQEDAHNSILNFDSRTSFFAVYDGHGGHEVAAYCAKYLPEFLKTIEEYSKDDIEAALKKLFLKFDESLLSEKALEELMKMRDTVSGQSSVHENEEANEEAAVANSDKAESDKDDAVEQKTSSKKISDAASEAADTIVSETAALYDEATMPLEEVLKRYASTEKKMNKALTKNHLKNAKSAHLSPVIKTKQVRLTAAELDKQEEIDITEIKKNGNVLLNGSETNCELDFDEASNLGDVTDSQKEGDTTSKSTNSIDSQPNKAEDSTTTTTTTNTETEDAKPGMTTESVDNKANHTPNSKHRLKLRQEEIKLSPIRNKSLSSSSLCDEAASSQKDDTMVSSVDGNEALGTEVDLVTTAKNDENKENDNGDQCKAKEAEVEDEGEEASAVVTTRSKRQSKADKNNLLAKLIAGVINKRLKRGQTSADNDKDDELYDEEDQDDDFDADYSEGDEEDSVDASGSEDSGDEEDDDEDDESDDEDYENDESDEEEDSDGNDYPISNGVSKPGFDSGCTAVVAVLRDNKKLYVANAGDSRCIVCRDGKAVDMSYDHKPEDDLERERVEKAGGQVTSDGRINNGLNLSRAIGDHTYKRNKDLPLAEQMITSLPDVLTLDIDTTKDKFMVLACDGIWNFMSSQEVCDYVTERLEANYAKLSQICEELFLHCLAPNTEGDGTGCDNMTCILVTFQPFQKVELKVSKSALMNVEKNDLKRTGSANIDDTNLAAKKLKTEEEQTQQVTV